MLFVEDHSGTVGFIGGIMVLVIAGVGLSMLVDKRFVFSSALVNLENEVTEGAEELEEISGNYQIRSKLLAQISSHREKAANDSSFKDLIFLEPRSKELLLLRDQLRSSVENLERDFTKYRENYRSKTWQSAVGESLGDFEIKNGRKYKDATISEVTLAGLNIRHSSGTTRIQAADLPPEIQARFQWNDEARRQALKAKSD